MHIFLEFACYTISYYAYVSDNLKVKTHKAKHYINSNHLEKLFPWQPTGAKKIIKSNCSYTPKLTIEAENEMSQNFPKLNDLLTYALSIK